MAESPLFKEAEAAAYLKITVARFKGVKTRHNLCPLDELGNYHKDDLDSLIEKLRIRGRLDGNLSKQAKTIPGPPNDQRQAREFLRVHE